MPTWSHLHDRLDLSLIMPRHRQIIRSFIVLFVLLTFLFLWKTTFGDKFLHPNADTATDTILRIPIEAVDTNGTEPSWSCHVIDQLSYCVYYRSLCVDKDASLVLLTTDATKQGNPVEMLNQLSPSPWHRPGIELYAKTSFGRYDVPFRSFFSSAQYASRSSVHGAADITGWSLIAAFDADNYNVYHYMTKMQAAFVARLYELGGLKERRLTSPDDLLETMRSPASEFDYAYLFRPQPTSWQRNYGELCLGNKTKFTYSPQHFSHASELPLCFEKAIIPGAALYLADGLISSDLFRELAAEKKGIRVPAQERNVITIFDRSQENRRILNLKELSELVKNAAHGMEVTVVNWDGDAAFEIQAMHMARTRIMIATHGSILNHNVFMESAGVVIEINAYQFLYPLDAQIVLFRGNHYIRYEENIENCMHQGFPLGHDPFPGKTTRQCMDDMDCQQSRRDADIQVNTSKFIAVLHQALSMIS